jgi:oxygen-independent coproporphyrinogen-3 oxidase
LSGKYSGELEFYRKLLGKRIITSVYFGGGTPSLMKPEAVAKVLEAVDGFFGLAGGAEISIEANPRTVDIQKLRAFRAAGINRISIGAQSLDDSQLEFLGRAHGAKDALTTIENARRVFDNISADFIYAIPGQSSEDWARSLQAIEALGLPHLSLYQLSIEKGTKLYGTRPVPESLARSMFEYTNRRLRRTCPQYEISNYARPGSECRHNINYWNGGEYIGIGPSAAGRLRIDGKFYETKNSDGPVLKPLGKRARARELILTGLRMNRGIDFKEFEAGCGLSFWDAADRKVAERLAAAGLLAFTDKKIRLLKRGRIMLDHIAGQITL